MGKMPVVRCGHRVVIFKRRAVAMRRGGAAVCRAPALAAAPSRRSSHFLPRLRDPLFFRRNVRW